MGFLSFKTVAAPQRDCWAGAAPARRQPISCSGAAAAAGRWAAGLPLPSAGTHNSASMLRWGGRDGALGKRQDPSWACESIAAGRALEASSQHPVGAATRRPGLQADRIQVQSRMRLLSQANPKGLTRRWSCQ